MFHYCWHREFDTSGNIAYATLEALDILGLYYEEAGKHTAEYEAVINEVEAAQADIVAYLRQQPEAAAKVAACSEDWADRLVENGVSITPATSQPAAGSASQLAAPASTEIAGSSGLTPRMKNLQVQPAPAGAPPTAGRRLTFEPPAGMGRQAPAEPPSATFP
jgi:hypothetical protein